MAFVGIQNVQMYFSHTEQIDTQLLEVQHQRQDGCCLPVCLAELVGIMYSKETNTPHIRLSSQELIDWVPMVYPEFYQNSRYAIVTGGLYFLHPIHCLDYLKEGGICEAMHYPFTGLRSPLSNRRTRFEGVKYKCGTTGFTKFRPEMVDVLVQVLQQCPLFGVLHLDLPFITLRRGEIYPGPLNIRRNRRMVHAVLITGYGKV
ncbi:uncharacterized protein LOC116002523 isoform X1 [Ipomoea triloba]|nr:uncharacterized protein LOC116002523 isoform X1 [Ipomoea triloba]